MIKKKRCIETKGESDRERRNERECKWKWQKKKEILRQSEKEKVKNIKSDKEKRYIEKKSESGRERKRYWDRMKQLKRVNVTCKEREIATEWERESAG